MMYSYRQIAALIAVTLCSLGLKAELTVSLLTVAPGREVHQLEGHTELQFTDPDRDLDETVSWGIFDFESPGFIYRFVKGDTDYLCASHSYNDFLLINGYSGRRVIRQRLNLDSIQAERLLALAERNMLPENRVYRYKYVTDNCATRPLNLIEQAIGSPLEYPGDTLTSSTWRKEMARFHANYPWYQFGIDLALGSGIDKPITNREKCYSPVNLAVFLSGASHPDGRGIVDGGEPQVILEGVPEGLPSPPTPWYLTPMFMSLMVLTVTLLTARHDIKHRKVSRWLYTTLYTIAGVAGLVLTFLIFISTHEATSPNWLYLWLNPLCFTGVIGVWLKKHNRVVYFYQIVNFVALLALTVIGITGTQHLNSADYPLIVSFFITAIEYIYLYRCQQKSTSPSKAA